MDGEVRGEEYSPAPKEEGHHVRNSKSAKEWTVFSTQFCVLFKEGGPLDSYYTWFCPKFGDKHSFSVSKKLEQRIPTGWGVGISYIKY